LSILALRSGTLILVSLFSKTLKSFCFQICWWWVYLMTWRLFQKRFTCTTLVIYVFIIIAGSTSPAGGLSVLETNYVFIIIAGSTSPAGGLSVLETNYVFIIIAGSTSPAGGLSVLETIYVFIIIAGSTSPAGGLSVLETIFHPRNEINIVYFFSFFLFFW
jgi:hypothetical protein